MENQPKITNRKGFFRFLVFVALLGLFDVTCGKILQFLFYKQKSGYQYRTSYAVDSTRQPGLIFGSSRANHHYVTHMLADSLGMPFYNVGRDGQSILYDYAILQTTLKRYTPKLILLDYQDEELLYFATSYERLSNLLPYAKSHPEINRTIQMRSANEKLKMISQIYPYNSLLFTILGGMSPGAAGKVEDENGYLPLDQPFHTIHPDRNKFLSIRASDSNKIKAFDAFINLCKQKGIELYVVMSPYFKPVDQKFTNPIDERIRFAGVPHFDYSHLPEYMGKKDFFSDESHLNREGSRLFTQDLISRIRANRELTASEPSAGIGVTDNPESVSSQNAVPTSGTDTVNLILIQGESNATGMALNTEATPAERKPRINARILNNNSLEFEALQLGVNNNIKQNVGDQTTHGLEVGLANAADAGSLSRPTYLVKAGGSGSWISEWLPDGKSRNPTVYGWAPLTARMDAAVHYLHAHHTPYRITVWQSIGINDYNAKTTNDQFKSRMLQFRRDLRNRYGSHIPFLATHFFPSHPYNAVIDDITASDPLRISAAIDITGATYREPNIHWDDKGFKIIAKRMVQKMDEKR